MTNLVSQMIESIKENNIALEINCENTKNPKRFIDNIVREIHEDTGYDVAYINLDSIYHIIINKNNK